MYCNQLLCAIDIYCCMLKNNCFSILRLPFDSWECGFFWIMDAHIKSYVHVHEIIFQHDFITFFRSTTECQGYHQHFIYRHMATRFWNIKYFCIIERSYAICLNVLMYACHDFSVIHIAGSQKHFLYLQKKSLPKEFSAVPALE